ncbi:MAG: mannose-1-phosphate guanylyltransferase/mannose-6-phosphate isomerase [Hyphomicrobiaceae bacterium]
MKTAPSPLKSSSPQSITVQPVILSGGSGKRLWPLSRHAYPKQFLKLLSPVSLFQDTALRLLQKGFALPLVIANEEHRFIVAEQLREQKLEAKSILLEPVSRNTALPALVGALMVGRDGGDDALVLLVPSDHAIADPLAFRDAVMQGVPAARTGDIVVFGVPPDRPHTGYGYIEIEAGEDRVRRVARFVEKPDRATAEAFLKSGRFLWNAGIFLFSAATIIEAAARECPDILSAAREALGAARADLDFVRLDRRALETCPAISIDYALIETARNLACVPLDAGWSDLGSWSEVWEISGKDEAGNAGVGDVRFLDARNCLAHAEEGTLAVVGLEDAVVVATRDAVLVASRDESQRVKEIVEALEREGREEAVAHRRAHRPWGWYERIAAGDRYQVKCIMVKPGASLSLQSHVHRSEHWVVVSGTVAVTIGDEVRMLAENQSTYVPVGARHRLANPGMRPAFLIEVQSGAYLGEDDIVRFEDNYGRALPAAEA